MLSRPILRASLSPPLLRCVRAPPSSSVRAFSALYTAKVHTVGGRVGESASDDGKLKVDQPAATTAAPPGLSALTPRLL